MRHPKFSVIIPTYNRESYLRKAIDSVLSQTFPDFELIIIDDGSMDNTNELIRSYSDPRFQYAYQENHGVAHARNRGLERARGKFIAFLDSDDWWLPQKLQRCYDAILEAPDIKIFHTEEKWFIDGKIHNPKIKHKKPSGYVYQEALPLCCISISTAVIDRSVFYEVGVFNETMAACEDYDFWLRATNKYKVKLIPEYLTEKDGGRADQLSLSVWGLDRFRILALDRMLCSYLLNEDDYDLTLRILEKKCAIFIQGAQRRGNIESAQFFQSILDKYNTPAALSLSA